MTETSRADQMRHLAERLETLLNDIHDAGLRLGWGTGELSVVDPERKVRPEIVGWDPETQRWER